jgi:hypothetical protein
MTRVEVIKNVLIMIPQSAHNPLGVIPSVITPRSTGCCILGLACVLTSSGRAMLTANRLGTNGEQTRGDTRQPATNGLIVIQAVHGVISAMDL